MAKKGKSGAKGFKPPTKLSSLGKGSNVKGLPGHCAQPKGKPIIRGK